MITKEQVQAYFKVLTAVAEAVRELEQIPSGHLYAVLMGKISFEDYQSIIRVLEKAELIRIDGFHLVHWIGPKEQSNAAQN